MGDIHMCRLYQTIETFIARYNAAASPFIRAATAEPIFQRQGPYCRDR